MTKITTDVDRILEYVRERQRAEIIEIARALNIKAGDVDKWAKVLEREGVVRIEYNITKMYIVWAGKGGVLQSAHAYEGPQNDRAQERRIEKKIIPAHTDSGKLLPRPSKARSAEEGMAAARQQKHNPYYAHSGRDGQAQLSKSARDSSSSQRVAVMFHSLLPPKAERQVEDAAKKGERPPTQKPQSSQLRDTGPLHAASQKPQPAEFQDVDLGRATELSNLLKSKVEAINAVVAEMAELKAEREKLYSTEYAPLLSRFDSQLSSLSEKLAEREAVILALKKRAAGLPDEAARAENEMQDSLKLLSSLQEEYAQQLSSLAKLRGEIARERESIRSEIAHSRNSVKSCIESLSGIEESVSSLNAMREQALRRVEEARKKIAEETALVGKMAALVEESGSHAEQLDELLKAILGRAQSAEAVLNKVESYDAKLAEAERTLSEIEHAYSRKISELKKVAEARDAEIKRLRLEIEQGALQRYIQEINRVSKEAEQEANTAVQKEQEIEERLKAAKARLQQLLKESRELSKKFGESG